MKNFKTGYLSRITLLGLCALTVSLGASAADSSPDYAFYKGKTANVIVPYKPGGHFDRMARLMAHFMAAPLGVKQIHVINRPGGAAIVGTNAIYNAKPDGLTFGITPGAGVIISQIAKTPGVSFDVTKFNWIGQAGEDPEVLWAHKGGKFHSFKDFMQVKAPIKNLASGKGGVEYVGAQLLYSIFGIPHRMISVFNSHMIMATFLSGQGDAFVLSASSTLAHAGDKVIPIVTLLGHGSKHVPGVPTVIEAANKYHLGADKRKALKVLINTLAVHRAFFAPPGVPKNRLAALRDAMQKIVHDSAFQREAKKEGLFLGYSSPARLKKEAQFTFAHQQVLKQYLGEQH